MLAIENQQRRLESENHSARMLICGETIDSLIILVATVNTLQIQLDSLIRQISQKDSEMASMRDEALDLTHSFDESVVVGETRSVEIERLSNLLAIAESRLTFLQTQNLSLKQQVGSAREKASLNDNSIFELRGTLKGLEKKYSNLLAELKGKSVSVFKGK